MHLQHYISQVQARVLGSAVLTHLNGLFPTHAICPCQDSCCSDSCHIHSGMQADETASLDAFWSEKTEHVSHTKACLLKLPEKCLEPFLFTFHLVKFGISEKESMPLP